MVVRLTADIDAVEDFITTGPFGIVRDVDHARPGC